MCVTIAESEIIVKFWANWRNSFDKSQHRPEIMIEMKFYRYFLKNEGFGILIENNIWILDKLGSAA